MAGKVYCFNNYNEPLEQFNVNGSPFGSATPAIGGWAASGSTIYTPQSVAVPRVKHGDEGGAVFPDDMPTALRMNWDSFTVQTSLDLENLPNVSLNDDLILYIAINQLVLMTTRGFVLKSQPISPRAQNPNAEKELKALDHHHH